MGKTQLAPFSASVTIREAEILNHTVVKAVSSKGLFVNVCVCVFVVFYLESSVCPDNALHTGNALTGSYRTEAAAE